MESTLNIPKTNGKEFWGHLSQRKFENTDAIKTIERYLHKKRGYVFKMPKKGEPAILLISGGIDSVVAWGLLLHHFKLKVYPLYLDRGYKRKKKEKRAVDFFANYYQKRYPDFFIAPKHYSTHLPPPEVERAMENPQEYLHPEKILETLNPSAKKSSIDLVGISPYMFPFYGVLYAKNLEYQKNFKVRTIFLACGTTDGTDVPNQTFTAMRSTTLGMCLATADFSWNFASIFMEKELGHWLDKGQIISLGDSLNIPLKKTWSCYSSGKYHCGTCRTCWERKNQFLAAKVLDKTKYESDILLLQIFNTIKSFKSLGS